MAHSLGGYLTSGALRSQNVPTNIQELVFAFPVTFPPKPSNAYASNELPTPLRLVDALWSANVAPQQLVHLFGYN